MLEAAVSIGSEMIDVTDSHASTTSSSSGCSFSRSSSTDQAAGVHRCVAVLQGHEGNVMSLALAGDDMMLYSGSDRGDIRAWEHPGYGKNAKRFGCGEGSVKSLVVVGNKLISAHQDCKIRVWRRSKRRDKLLRLVTSVPSLKDYLINFLPPNNNYVQVWRHKKALWIDHHDTISVLAAGTDVLYSGSWDKTIKVWRLSDFKCLESVTSHIDAVNALAIDEKQGFLYSGSADTTIKVWERSMQAQHSTRTTMQKKPQAAAIMHHTLIATLEAAQKSPVNALALSPDGSILYSGLSNKTIAVWKKQHGGGGGDGNDDDELRGKQHHHMVPAGLLKGHCLAVLCLSTIADLLISGSADKTVRVWRRSRGKDALHSCVSVMQGHKGPVKSLCTSNCSSSSSSVSAATTRMGFLVYSGSMDCDVRVWWVPEQDREEESFSDDDDGSFQESPPPPPQLVRWNLLSPTS